MGDKCNFKNKKIMRRGADFDFFLSLFFDIKIDLYVLLDLFSSN